MPPAPHPFPIPSFLAGPVGRRRAGLAAALFVLAAGGMPVATARAASVAATYRVFVGGVSVLDVDATLELGGDRYTVALTARTEGFLGRLFPWQTKSSSEGARGPGGMVPRLHRQDSVFRGEPRTVTLGYDVSGDVTAEVTPPPETDDREPVPPALRRGSTDVLSAVLSLVDAVGRGEGCTRTLPVFDGRRRYDMNVAQVGPRVVGPSQLGIYAGTALQCRIGYTPIAGYNAGSGSRFWQRRDAGERPPADLWLAPVVAGLPPLPVRLETESDFGGVVVHLTAIRPPGAAPSGAGPGRGATN